MSRKRLDHEINALMYKYISSIEKRERIHKYLVKYGVKESELDAKVNEFLKQLSDEQRIKIFSPIYKLTTDQHEREYIAGDSLALLRCIDFCCTKKIVIPNWAAEAFHLGYTKIRNYEAKSWDTVFGKPHKKGTHLKEQRCEEDKISIHKYVKERIDQGHPIDQELFDLAAQRFGSNAKEIKDIYYDLEHKRVNQLLDLYKGAEIVDKALSELYPNRFQKKSR